MTARETPKRPNKSAPRGGCSPACDPRADRFALMLGDGRENVNGQAIGERHVGGDELDAAFHERETNATFLASLSSLATTSRAFRRLQAASAAASCGRLFRLCHRRR